LGQTALHGACAAGHDDIVARLLRGGADINVVDNRFACHRISLPPAMYIEFPSCGVFLPFPTWCALFGGREAATRHSNYIQRIPLVTPFVCPNLCVVYLPVLWPRVCIPSGKTANKLHFWSGLKSIFLKVFPVICLRVVIEVDPLHNLQREPVPSNCSQKRRFPRTWWPKTSFLANSSDARRRQARR